MESTTGAPRTSPLGDALFQELLWVHDNLRRDLATVQQLAARVPSGMSAEAVRAEIAALQAKSPLWQFRANCLYYCRFVHAHHGGEDHLLFPIVRRTNPELGGVVDRLEADHRQIAVHLDEIEGVAGALISADTTSTRQRMVAALRGLADHLLAHLTYEEESIGPALRAWTRWP
jgi:iron-sulfur cluster repair protein YtfE (RIC family)